MATKKEEAERQEKEALVNALGQTTSGRPGGVWTRFRRFFGGRRDEKGKLAEKPSVTLLNLHTETGWNQTLKEWATWPTAQRSATQAVVSGLMLEAVVELTGAVRTVGREVLELLDEGVEEEKKRTALLEELVALSRVRTARPPQVIDAPKDGEGEGDADSDEGGGRGRTS